MVKITRVLVRDMANPRLAFTTVLAGVTFAIAVFGMIGANPISSMQTGMPGHAGLAASHFAALSASHVPGLIALALSVAAFMVSWSQRSYLMAGFLIGAGIIYTVHLAPFLGDHGIIAFPGPVVGLFSGHVILGLGVAKAIGSTRTPVTKTIT